MSDKGFQKVFSNKYILASKSPRRSKMLKQIGLNFMTYDSKSEELDHSDLGAVDLIRYNSMLKSRKAASDGKRSKGKIIIGADTVVVLDKKIINKPFNSKDAVNILKSLSGKKHYVYTGINLINMNSGKEIFDHEKTSVYFRKLEDDEIKHYVKTHKPLDKAGAYGIQDDFGCLFIEKIVGDYYNIVGLPLLRLFNNLKKIV
ncbi:MAG TPA: Maf family protein [Ignavibacteria bacterium]|nr:Maf family protein [Ignavibacteria bacterium]